MKNYIEISVETTSLASEIVAYFLSEATPFGVCIFDPRDAVENSSWDYAEPNLFDKNQAVTVKAFCEKEDEKSVLDFLAEKFAMLDNQTSGSLKISTCEVDADAWHEKWKETFVPLEIGKFVICPEWCEYNSQGKLVLKLDSGIAFGTGQHETTKMCLELLSDITLKDKTVVDVGCGSGILGLCALLAGAKNVLLIDNDSQATEATLHNAKQNCLQTKCKIQNGNLVDSTNEAFDVVLANLTAEILLVLAKDVSKIVKKGSIIILSGILLDRVDKVKQCFLQNGFKLLETLIDGEWCALKLEC